MSSDEWATCVLGETSIHRRDVGTAEAVAPGREHEVARRHAPLPGRGAQGRDHELPFAVEPDEMRPALGRDVGDPTVPVEVLGPVEARDAVDAGEGLGAVLGLVPGAEGQVRQAERRARELLGRAQGLHAGIGRPRTGETLPAAIDDGEAAQAQPFQPECRREPAHAAPDDEHVEHRPDLGVDTLGHPILGRLVEQRQVAPQQGLEFGERARNGR